MTEKDYEIVRELKDRLSKVVQLVDFRIFGSRARIHRSMEGLFQLQASPDTCQVCGEPIDECICCPECGHLCPLDLGELYCPVCRPEPVQKPGAGGF